MFVFRVKSYIRLLPFTENSETLELRALNVKVMQSSLTALRTQLNGIDSCSEF